MSGERRDEGRVESKRVADGRSDTVVPLRSEPESEAYLTVHRHLHLERGKRQDLRLQFEGF